MAKTIEFEKVRKRRQRIEAAKRLAALALIISAIGGLLALNNLFVEGRFTVRVSDLLGSYGGEGFPAALPGGVIRDMKAMGKNLAVLTDSNLYIYNDKARNVSTIQQMSANTVMLAGKDRILTFDTGKNEYSLHTTGRTEKIETEDGMLAAAMSDNLFALVVAASQYVAEVSVYGDAGGEPLYRWMSPDNHVTGTALSPAETHMAVSSVMTENGMLKSQVVLFDLKIDEKLESIDFPDSLILHLDFRDAESLRVLTDNEFAVFDLAGKKIGSHALDGDPVTGIEAYEGETLIMTENREARTCEVILLGEEGEVLARLEAPNNIRGMAIGKSRIYILNDTGIEAFDRRFNAMEKLELRGITHLKLAGDKLYYCTAEEICEYEI